MRAASLALLLFLRCNSLITGSFFKKSKEVCDGNLRPVITGSDTGSQIRHLKPGEIFWANYTREWDQFMDILYIPHTSPISSDIMTCSHWVVVSSAGAAAGDVETFMAATVNELVHTPCVAYVTFNINKIDSLKALEKKHTNRLKVVLDSAYIDELGKAIKFEKPIV